MIRRLAPCADVGTLGLEGAIEAVRAHGVAGIVTYSEWMIRLTAAIADACGLRFHDPDTAMRLTDKRRQREALAAAGIPCPRFALVRSPREFEERIAQIGVPAVLKPVHGGGSADTFDVRELGDVRSTAINAWRAGEGAAFILEEQLVGSGHPAVSWLSDYVSVETIAFEGEYSCFCITDKMPLAWPFRETGYIVPTSLPAPLRDEVVAVATSALRACGVTDGIAHTEIKLTADGPRVIEVNGRVGGAIPRLVKRVSGLDPLRIALDIALGRRPRAEGGFGGFSLHYLVPSPPDATVLERPPDPHRLRRVPGVHAVESVRAGTELDWRQGTASQLCTVWAEAPSLEAVRNVYEHVDEIVAETAVVGRQPELAGGG